MTTAVELRAYKFALDVTLASSLCCVSMPAQRVFTCPACGYGPIDRDVHAAVNIATHAVAVASDTGETQNARGGSEAAPTPVGRRRGAVETGRPRRETGVATPVEQSTGHLKHADQHALPLVS